jgi:hypothetical protein
MGLMLCFSKVFINFQVNNLPQNSTSHFNTSIKPVLKYSNGMESTELGIFFLKATFFMYR